MQTVTITIGKRAQVVIPKKARQTIGLKEGSKATLTYKNGMGIILPDPKESIKLLKGLGKEIWDKVGGADKYLKEERASWGNRG